MKIRTNIISIGLILLALFIAAIYLIGEKISDVGNDMNNANAREACRYRAESVAYEFKKTEELQRLAREFFGKSESYREQDLFSLLKTMQQLDPKLSRTWFFRGTNDSLRLLERNSSELRKMKLSGIELKYMYTLLDSHRITILVVRTTRMEGLTGRQSRLLNRQRPGVFFLDLISR